MMYSVDKIFTKILKLLVLIVMSSFIGKELVSQIVMNYSESLYYLPSSFKIIIFSAFVLIFVLFFLFFLSNKFQIKPIFAFGVVIFFTITWTLAGCVEPKADALHCINVAKELNDGVFFSLNAGQYLDAYRVNAPIIFYMVILCKIFGNSHVVIAFQIINSIIFSYSVYVLYKYLFNRIEKRIATFVFYVLVLFLPMLMEVTFVYGNCIGHSLGIISLILFLESLNERYPYKLILAFATCLMAGAFKGYMYILLVAFVMVLCCYNKNFKVSFLQVSVGIAIILLYFALFNVALNVWMNKVTDGNYNRNGGVSLLANVNMGLDVYEDSNAPGWYNSYNIGTYLSSNYNKSEQTKLATEDFEKVLSRIANNPLSYFRAMSKKIHTIWNEPTFESLFRNSSDFGKARHSDWWVSIVSFSDYTNLWVVRFLRMYQILIYFGVILYIVFVNSSERLVDNIGLLIFFGAYCFYIIWEAKSEYAMVFFFLLIPYAAYIYYILINKILGAIMQKKIGNKKNNKKAMITLGLSTIVIGISIMLFKVDYSVDEYSEYLKDHAFINSGDHDIKTANGEITISNIFFEFNYINWSYVLYDNKNRKYEILLNWDPIEDRENDKYACNIDGVIDIYDWEELDRMLDNADNYTWHIVQLDYGEYLIKWWADQNKVWTYDKESDSIVLKDYSEGDLNQIWLLD